MPTCYCSVCKMSFESDHLNPEKCEVCGQPRPLEVSETPVASSHSEAIVPSLDSGESTISDQKSGDVIDGLPDGSDPSTRPDPWQQFLENQRGTLASENEHAMPRVVPTYRLYSTTSVVVAGFFAQPIVMSAFLLGVNYRRLGLKAKSRLAFLGAVLAYLVLLSLIMTVPALAMFYNGIFVLAAVGAAFNVLQDPYLSAHEKAGGRLESIWKPLGMAGMLFAVTVGFAFAWNWHLLGTRVAIGRDDEIYYKGGVTVEEALKLGKFLKSDGFFDNGSQQSAVLSQSDGTKQIRFFLEVKSKLSPDFADGYEALAEDISAEVFHSQPVEISLVDEFDRLLRRLEPAVGFSKKPWEKLTEEASKALDQEEYATAEAGYRAAVKEAESHNSLRRLLISSLNNVGFTRLRQELTDDVEPHFQRALSVANSVLGPNSYEAGYALNGLGLLEEKRGNTKKAIEFFRRALTIRKALGKEYESDYLDTLDSIIGLLMDDHDYVSGEEFQQQRLTVIENRPNPVPLEIVAGRRLLGSLKLQSGKYEESQKLYRSAIEALNGVQPPPYKEYVDLLLISGQIDCLLGDYETAERSLRRAIELKKQLPEDDDLLTAKLYDSLADVLYERSQYHEAEELYGQVLNLRERLLGKEHADVAEVLSQLGAVTMELGRFTEADRHLSRAVRIFEKADNHYRERLSDCLQELGQLHHSLRQYSTAETIYQRALLIREQVLGEEHEKVATTVGSLSSLYCDRRDYSHAETFARKSLELTEKRLGAEHPLTIQALERLGRVMSGQGQFTDAEDAFRRALEVGTRVWGAEHLYLAKTKSLLAMVLLVQDRSEEALPFLIESEKSFKEIVGPDHPYLISPLNNIGVVYRNLGNHDAALEHFSRAVRIAEQLLGKSHPDLLLLLSNKAQALRDLNRPDEAAEIENRIEEIQRKQEPDFRPPQGPFVG